MELRPSTSRQVAALLGVGLALFSFPAVVAPRLFARVVGLPVGDGPAAVVAFQGLAARDVVMGVGLASAARRGGRLPPWLLLRAFCDGFDAIAIAFAFARGGGNWRLGGLGLLAAAAAAVDAALWLAAEESPPGG